MENTTRKATKEKKRKETIEPVNYWDNTVSAWA